MADLYFKSCVNSDMCHMVKRRSQSVNFTRSARLAEYDQQSDQISRMSRSARHDLLIFRRSKFSDIMHHNLRARRPTRRAYSSTRISAIGSRSAECDQH